MFKSVAIFAAAFTALASPTAAKPLTVRIGETWLFSVRHGAPVDAHKVVPANAGASGQFKVSLQPLFGATMTITNASRFDYAYRATLVLPSGKSGTAKADP